MNPFLGNIYGNKFHFNAKWKSRQAGFALLAFCGMLLFLLNVNAQTARFTINPVDGNLCAPSKINFVPSFSEKPEYFFWNFGQNDEESEINSPTVTYVTPGTYQVVLTVVFKNLVTVVKNNVTVYGPSPINIQSERDYLCKPAENTFSIKNTDTLKSVTWDFGNGNIIAGNQNSPVKYSFTAFGSYNISVEAENKWGCKSKTQQVFKVEKPKAIIKDTLINGCSPVEVNFSAGILLPAGSSVVKYVWNFNDGSPPQTTNENKVRHTFSKADTFVTTLSVTTAEGCENSFSFPPVALGSPPPRPSIIPASQTICASDMLLFSASSPAANSYFCEVSDGTTYESKEGKFSHEFKSLGTFKIKVTPANNGCAGTADSINIVVRGVIARIAFNNTCAQKNRFSFRNTSIGTVNSVQWNFETISSPVSVNNPEYTFPEQGRFPVSLIVRQNSTGCADTAVALIYTAKPTLAPLDTFICLNTPVNAEIRNTYTNPRTTYIWSIAGKTNNNGSLPAYNLIADSEGLFTNQVIISNGLNYCRDTLVQPLKMRVAGHAAAFETIGANCMNEKIFIQNSSKSQFGLPQGIRWNWDFGNGMSSDVRDPAAVVYDKPGVYKISMRVVDAKGCTDSASEVLRIRREPFLKLETRQQKICQGQEITLNTSHTGEIFWRPSNMVNCDTCSSVKVKPMAPTEYQVMVRDSLGCSSADTVTLDVWLPFELAPNLIRDTAVCYGTGVPYDLKTHQKVVSWSPEAGLSSNRIPNPVARPENTTTYIATVSDSAGCFVRTVSAVLTINPLPIIDHDTLLVVPFEAPFTINPKYSNNIISYTWKTSSQLSCLDCPNPSGIATESALFELEVVSDKACRSSATINLAIDCSSKNINMPTAFSPDKNGLNDYYYPLTRGIRLIRRFAVFNRYGQIIFERKEFVPNNRFDGWDGTFKGKMQPAGMYTYWVELLCASGNLEHYKGSFLLLK